MRAREVVRFEGCLIYLELVSWHQMLFGIQKGTCLFITQIPGDIMDII